MFEINEHTAIHSGRSLQEANQKVAKIAATATLALIKLTASILQKLIQSIINRLRSKQDSSIEIKMNNQLLFKGKTGEKPTVNSLSINSLTAILESAIADGKQNLELLVKADNEIVYASKRGKVEIDRLDTFLQTAKNSNQKAAPSHGQAENEVNQSSIPSELESNSLIAIVSVKRVLDELQTDEYENQNYHFRRECSNITVSAKNDRGEIVKLEAGRITTNNLSQNDVKALVSIADQLKLQSLVAVQPVQEHFHQEVER